MALERVLPRLRRLGRIEPLDRDAALDAAAGVPVVVGHARHSARHELEAAFAALPRLHVDGVGGRLGGLRREDGERFEVVDVQGAGGHGDDEFGGGQGEGEGFGGEVDGGGDLGGVGWVVDVQGGVPGGGD